MIAVKGEELKKERHCEKRHSFRIDCYNIDQITAPNGNVLKEERQSDVAGTTWQLFQYTYDLLNHLKTVKDPLNRTTTFNYAGLSILEEKLNSLDSRIPSSIVLNIGWIMMIVMASWFAVRRKAKKSIRDDESSIRYS